MRHKSDMNVGGESDRWCTTFEVPEQMSRRVAEEGGRNQGEHGAGDRGPKREAVRCSPKFGPGNKV
jgi:hypothetical protein